VHNARLTPGVIPLFKGSNDAIGITNLSLAILRTLRVARSELVYTGWILRDKKLNAGW